MKKTEVALAAATVTIVVLGYKLHTRNRQLNKLRSSSHKLIEWSNIAQRVILETWTEHPELISKLSQDLNVDIQFYNIMSKEDLY